MATNSFQIVGKNPNALFSLKVHRGEGMALLAMNWLNGTPTNDFVGFAIEYKYPKGNRYIPIKNRITFEGFEKDSDRYSSLRSPIQMFRWVHFPTRTNDVGLFTYRVTPVFMSSKSELTYGEPQVVSIDLFSDTYPDELNVTFTRGFIASQAFVDRYGKEAVKTLLPLKAALGVDFVPTHPKSKEALEWMGFEAREKINQLLSEAIEDQESKVYVVAYDLSIKEIADKLQELGARLKIIIDDSGDHNEHDSGENQVASKLALSAGNGNVKRQNLGGLQHNKMIVVDSPRRKAVVFGSTNFSWRGFFVQANNALIVQGKQVVDVAKAAFNNYWDSDNIKAKFVETNSAVWNDLGLPTIDAKVTFSPHSRDNSVLESIAADIKKAKTSVFYSLAFLHQMSKTGALVTAIDEVTADPRIFVYGMSDKRRGGLDLQKPNGNVAPVFASNLTDEALPEPFKSEPSGGTGTQLHHKFVVLDFDKPSARVYLGSYNFSNAADRNNGENLVLIKDKKVAVSYMIEALRLFDHYHFRVKQAEARNAKIFLSKPPQSGQEAWWKEAFTETTSKHRDRLLFS
ncbi:phosphatidylserine/phosphatidylglycerophosphate/cardiolipin synthase-like enzyme [Runella defluvii]|uniref:phospholipase D n=1 Tax=Runella defluvii TaxID=370973 RepID=A0A7W6EPK3_9BACT|nr:phospholipase D-like domain-containing protein [Runella defluvii]MBB3837644.1 phosphatidylserine/phosphatidylglycerophosphate/cardiolipin synthase-like enzyme [Runella defluvii]